ncbi:MAG: GNAT family N-acetyltransferase [Candidatus Poribacteria bacterium]
MQIRPLDVSRADEVVALWEAAHAHTGDGVDQLGEALTRQYLSELTQSDRFVPTAAVIAEEQGIAVGAAWGIVEREPGFGADDYRHTPAQLKAVAVHPDHRGRGVARALLSHIENAMRDRGHLAIDYTPDAVEVNAAAYRFLNSLGYIAVLYNYDISHDLSRFELTPEVAERRRRLQSEGVTIRWMEQSDQDALLDLWREYFPYWSIDDKDQLNEFRQHAGRDSWGFRYLLAEANDRLVGFVGDIWPQPDGEGSFTSPGVIPAFRSRGIATVLLYLALDYMKSEGTLSTSYMTSGMNPAQFLYLRAGATIRSVVCNWYRKLLVE